MVRLRYLAAVFLFATFTAQSQSLKRYYVSNLQAKGVLYFILPQNIFKSADTDFTYDITYMSKADSVTFNFTVFAKDFFQVQQLQLQTNTSKVQVPVQKLYVEAKKAGWTARYSTKISYADMQDFFKNKNTPQVVLQQNGSSKTLSCKAKQWKKTSTINNKIVQVINYNS